MRTNGFQNKNGVKTGNMMHIPEEDFCRCDGINTRTRINVHRTEEPSVDVFDSNEAVCWI